MKQKKNRLNKYTKKLLILLILTGFSAMNINGSGRSSGQAENWEGTGWEGDPAFDEETKRAEGIPTEQLKKTTPTSTPQASPKQQSTSFFNRLWSGRGSGTASTKSSASSRPTVAKPKAPATTSSPGPLAKMRNYIQSITTPTIDKIIKNTKNQLQIAFTKLNNQLKADNKFETNVFTTEIRTKLDNGVDALEKTVTALKKEMERHAANIFAARAGHLELD